MRTIPKLTPREKQLLSAYKQITASAFALTQDPGLHDVARERARCLIYRVGDTNEEVLDYVLHVSKLVSTWKKCLQKVLVQIAETELTPDVLRYVSRCGVCKRGTTSGKGFRFEDCLAIRPKQARHRAQYHNITYYVDLQGKLSYGSIYGSPCALIEYAEKTTSEARNVLAELENDLRMASFAELQTVMRNFLDKE